MTRQISAAEVRPGDRIKVETTDTRQGVVTKLDREFGRYFAVLDSGSSPMLETDIEYRGVVVTLLERNTPTGLYQAPGGSILFYDGTTSMNVRTGNSFKAEPGDEFVLIKQVDVEPNTVADVQQPEEAAA